MADYRTDEAEQLTLLYFENKTVQECGFPDEWMFDLTTGLFSKPGLRFWKNGELIETNFVLSYGHVQQLVYEAMRREVE